MNWVYFLIALVILGGLAVVLLCALDNRTLAGTSKVESEDGEPQVDPKHRG